MEAAVICSMLFSAVRFEKHCIKCLKTHDTNVIIIEKNENKQTTRTRARKNKLFSPSVPGLMRTISCNFYETQRLTG